MTSPYDWTTPVKYEFKLRRRILRAFYRRQGITSVHYEFIGGGDDGELADTTYYRGDQKFSPANVGFNYDTRIEDLGSNWSIGLRPMDVATDPVPRLVYAPLWQVESGLGFGIMELVGESGWWNDTGGRAEVIWDICRDEFDITVVEYIMTEGPPRLTRLIDSDHSTTFILPSNKTQK